MDSFDFIKSVPVSDGLIAFVGRSSIFLCDAALELLFEKPINASVSTSTALKPVCCFVDGRVFVQAEGEVFLLGFLEVC